MIVNLLYIRDSKYSTVSDVDKLVGNTVFPQLILHP